MNEKEELIAKVTNEAKKEAKKKNLNEAQTKLFIDEEVKKAVEDFDKNTVVESKKTETPKVENNTKKEVKYIVYTPLKNYCGVIAKVHFAYGKAEVKPGWVLNWFKEHGYKVEEVSN